MAAEPQDNAIIDLANAVARIESLEQQLSKPRSVWRDRSFIPILIATIGLATPLTTVVIANAQQQMKRLEIQQQADLKELELKKNIQVLYVGKATDQTDEAPRQRILRFILRAGDAELQAWAKEEYRLSQDLIKEEKAENDKNIEEIEAKILVLNAEVKRNPKTRASGELTKVRLDKQRATSTALALDKIIQSAPTLELQQVMCKNAQTLGGGLDSIRIQVDGLAVWEGTTCGGKSGNQGNGTQSLNTRVDVIGKCAQVKLLELDSGRNDSLGTSTICAENESGNIVFRGGSFWGGGKYHYEISYKFSPPSQAEPAP